jgi:hypothetical protein
LRSVLIDTVQQAEAKFATVPWIIPRALFVAQSIASGLKGPDAEIVMIIYNRHRPLDISASTAPPAGSEDCGEDYFDVVRLSSGLPVAWQVVASEAMTRSVQQFLDHPVAKESEGNRLVGVTPQAQPINSTSDGDQRRSLSSLVILVDVPEDVAVALKHQFENPCRFESVDSVHSLVQFEQSLRQGKQRLWLNFRDAIPGVSNMPSMLARWVWIARNLTLVVLCTLCGLFGLSQWMDNQALLDEESKQATIYRELFPQQKLPRSIRRTLESELAALRDSTSSSEKINLSKLNAAWVWFHAVRSIPDNPRSRIESMQFVDDRIVLLEGVTGTVEDLNQLIDALKQNGFSFALPNIQKVGNGVRIEIREAVLSENNVESLNRDLSGEGKP